MEINTLDSSISLTHDCNHLGRHCKDIHHARPLTLRCPSLGGTQMSFKHPLGRSQRLASNVNVVEAQPPPLWTHRRVRALATYVTGRRRTVQMSAMRGSFPGQVS